MSVHLLELPRLGEEGRLGEQGLVLLGTLLNLPCLPWPPGPRSRRMLTSGLMELQGDVGIKAQTEVVVEDIQGQLEKCQGVETRR